MRPADNTFTMDEDLSEVFQLIAEDERRRRYLKEVGDWLVEEYFELRQASWTFCYFMVFHLFGNTGLILALGSYSLRNDAIVNWQLLACLQIIYMLPELLS